MLDHLATLNEQPAWREMPETVRRSFTGGASRTGIGAEAAYAEFVENVLPYPNGNLHPRFFGWVQGNGTPLGMMADMLAAGMNAHLAGFNQAPALVEQQVIGWLAEALGFRGASGLMVSGGTMASTLGLAIARYAGAKAAGGDVREHGLQAWAEPRAEPLVFYGSTETHGWARKAAELLGLGHRAFRQVPIDSEYRMDLRALQTMLAADRAGGLRPFCVVGTAGTVNTGASDDLVAIAALARSERLWFHVDGAYGALAYLSPALRPQVAGLELADSLGFDLHKWGSLPFGCACLLVRDAEIHREAFTTRANYLAETTRGVMAGGLPFAERGLELTRDFKALKVWLTLKAEGSDKLARVIEQNVGQSRYLRDRIEASAELELLAPVPLNVVCFRYVGEGLGELQRDGLNRELLLRMQEQGVAVPSSTVIDGRFALRVCNVNHRTRKSDLDQLFEGVLRLGRELAAEAIAAA
ncbi:MAG: pyridoxal-dependent decarboxylase [Gemmatimonadota bacterium]